MAPARMHSRPRWPNITQRWHAICSAAGCKARRKPSPRHDRRICTLAAACLRPDRGRAGCGTARAWAADLRPGRSGQACRRPGPGRARAGQLAGPGTGAAHAPVDRRRYPSGPAADLVRSQSHRRQAAHGNRHRTGARDFAEARAHAARRHCPGGDRRPGRCDQSLGLQRLAQDPGRTLARPLPVVDQCAAGAAAGDHPQPLSAPGIQAAARARSPLPGCCRKA